VSNSKDEQRKKVANRAFKVEQLQRDAEQRVRDQQAYESAVSQKIARLRGIRLAHEAGLAEAAPVKKTRKQPARQAD
jgi:hypothetical protein